MSGTLECMRCLRVYPKGMDHCPNCTPTEKPQGAAAVPRVWIEPGTVEGCVEWCRAMKVKTHQSQIEFCSVAEKDAAVKAARNEGFQAAATLCEEEGPEALWEEAARSTGAGK